MKNGKLLTIAMLIMFWTVCVHAAYHHEGEIDSDHFLTVYPEAAQTKLDHCALCHSGGQYEKRPGVFTELGSCQWCHYAYGYDKSGDILSTLNPYGVDYNNNGRDETAVQTIGTLDSDGDGYSNIDEINANRFPGNANDDPSQKEAPYRVYTKSQLTAMAQHTQFMLMNTNKSGDAYVEYTGVPMETLLADAGMLNSATGITIYAPDGWSQYHPMVYDPEPEMYHVKGTYPEAPFYYDPQAEDWCDYSAPSVTGRNHGDPIDVAGGLKMILAYRRDGESLTPGVLGEDNKLDGEGPFRVVVPQKVVSPPDQASTAENQDVVWPYNSDWDHNAGACTRTATIIRVEPLPEGVTDIDIMEAGWDYVDEEKVIVYGALEEQTTPPAAEDDDTDECFIAGTIDHSSPGPQIVLYAIGVCLLVLMVFVFRHSGSQPK